MISKTRIGDRCLQITVINRLVIDYIRVGDASVLRVFRVPVYRRLGRLLQVFFTKYDFRGFNYESVYSVCVHLYRKQRPVIGSRIAKYSNGAGGCQRV